MSYARFAESGSDVYVYPTGERLICAGCSISSRGEYTTFDRTLMLLHLFMHRSCGDTVPQHAIDRLRAEIHGQPWRSEIHRTIRETMTLIDGYGFRRVEEREPSANFL